MSKTIKAIIIGDDLSNKDQLATQLNQHCPEVKLFGQADTVHDSVALIKDKQPEIVFLDVALKDGTGFDVLARFPKRGFSIIFVSSEQDFAIKAFRFSAVDFLLKPINPDELCAAVKRSKKHRKSIRNYFGIRTYISDKNSSEQEKRIVLTDLSNTYLVTIKDIVRCQGENSYTHFFLKDGVEVLVSNTLKYFENSLPGKLFFRAHQSHLINLMHIAKYNKSSGGAITMRDGSMVPVSTRRRNGLIDSIYNFVR